MRLPGQTREHPERLAREGHCLNCGTPVGGLNFCPECGQENFNYRTSLGRLVAFWWDRNVSIDGKLARTLWALIRRPGALTVAYLAGQRARYTPPAQIYFLTGLVYFFILTWTFSNDLEVSNNSTGFATDSSTLRTPKGIAGADTTRADSGRVQGFSIGPGPEGKPMVFANLSDEPIVDSLIRLDQDSIGRRIVQAGGWTAAPSALQLAFMQKTATAGVLRVFQKQIEAITLISVPLFALALFLFYRRTHRFFFDHLVTAVHFYSMSFLLAVPVFAINEEWAEVASIALVVYLLIYLLVSVRIVYKPSWLAAVWHVTVLIFYSFILMTLLLVGSVALNIAADWAVLRFVPEAWVHYAR